MSSFNTQKNRIILGIDPGTVVTGYALLHEQDNTFCALDFGCIKPPHTLLLSKRYHILFQGLCHLITTFQPTEMAIETPFMYKNAQSALKLGSALGCAIIAAKEHDICIYGYAPTQVKQGITGLGKSSKKDVECFVRAYLNLHSCQLQADTSDALSIALYHGMQHAQSTHNLKEL